MLKRRCDDYRDHLRQVFDYLLTNSAVLSHCSDMVLSCQMNKGSLDTARQRRQPGWKVSVEPNWMVLINDATVCGVQGRAKLIVGGHIEVRDGLLVNQSVAVCISLTPDEAVAAPNQYASEDLEGGQPVIVRRFHFDYDPSLMGNDRPRSHFQYGGRFQPGLVNVQNIRYRLYSSLDLPRIPFPPYDLVLTFDVFLSQFETPLSEIAEDSRWRSLVRMSEELWLNGYYRDVNRFLSGAQRSPTLYERLCEPVDWL